MAGGDVGIAGADAGVDVGADTGADTGIAVAAAGPDDSSSIMKGEEVAAVAVRCPFAP